MGTGDLRLSVQPAVLQVVILRDGLLVGTEVLVPGSYSVGSGPEADVKLDDPIVDPIHAVLYFQNGRSAIQDNNSRGGVYVNGHRVKAVEVRSQDEILCGPFVLKTRVVQKSAAQAKPAIAPEVAALLGAAPAPAAPQVRPLPPSQVVSPTVPSVRQSLPHHVVVTAPAHAAPSGGGESSAPDQAPPVRAAPAHPFPAPPVRAGKSRSDPAPVRASPPPPPAPRAVAEGATAISTRRAAALAAAPHLHAVQAAIPLQLDEPTESLRTPAESLTSDEELTASNTVPYAARGLSPLAATTDNFEPSVLTDPHALSPAHSPPRRQTHPSMPKVAVTSPTGARPKLYLELYWGEVRREARAFSDIDPKKPVRGGASDTLSVPLWGFSLPEDSFVLAEQVGTAYRVYVPPAAVAEKQGAGATAFMPLQAKELESDGERRFVTLSNGTAARFSEGEMSLVAYVAPPPEKLQFNPLAGLPWLVIALCFLMGGGFASFLAFGPKPHDLPDFTARGLNLVAVKLIAPTPEKKVAAAKKLAKIKKAATRPTAKAPSDKPKPRAPPKVVSRPPPPEQKALKALAKLSAAGPATNDVLAAIDKMGSGPGSRSSKNNFKLSGLVGKEPIANAGLGTFGLGGGGKGGRSTRGLEVLSGKGAGGIGALGAAGFGKGGRVGGTVARASARKVGGSASIDRDAVAKVINSHFQEVRACYERALLKEPGLSGKAVLEWSISTSGAVTTAKTKNSSLRNGEVEGCILRAIKTWKFPPAKGGSVVVTYPFLFNSVGY